MDTLPFATTLSKIVSPTALEVVMVMTPWARSVLLARSVARRANPSFTAKTSFGAFCSET